MSFQSTGRLRAAAAKTLIIGVAAISLLTISTSAYPPYVQHFAERFNLEVEELQKLFDDISDDRR